MPEAKSYDDSLGQLARLREGKSFTDYLGQSVERLSETAVAVGPGYNNVLSVAGYLALLNDHETYGKYVIPVE